MRYVVAMVGAIILALASTLLIAGPTADWYVAHRTFVDSDTVADVHAGVFMSINAIALILGWGVGWLASGQLIKPEEPI
jgi:hypothetical protein